MSKAERLIEKLESKLDNIEKLVDEISLLCLDCRTKIDKFNEEEHIEEFPELDEFEDDEVLDDSNE